MGYKCSFLDNEIYDAADVSRAFSRLSTAGVIAYPQTDTVAAALNEMTAAYAGDGVAPFGGLAVTMSGDTLTIGEGTAFFASGVSVEVDSEGITAERGEGDVYVALVYDEALNSVGIYVGQTEAEGDAVPLARIAADNTVTDMRRYARTKLVANSANVLYEFAVDFPGFKTKLTDNNAVAEYPLPHTDYKYLILKSWDGPDIAYYKRGEIADISGEEETEIYLSRSSNNFRLNIKRDVIS